MKQIGLSTQELVAFGLLEFGNGDEKIEEEINNNPLLSQFGGSAAFKQQIFVESVLRAVAVMIEQNNNALREQLKHLGVFPNQEQS